MYKAQKTIYGAIKGEITPGRPAIISMAIMGGRLGVKFETYNTVYTVVQDLF